MKKNIQVKNIALVGMFCALAYVSVLLGDVIPKVNGFLSYDPKDAVIVIAGFLLGPVGTVGISLIVSLIEMVTVSDTGWYGMMMNFFSTTAFALPAAIIYQKMRSYRGAILSLITGVIVMSGCMVLWNYIITPFYMGIPRVAVAAMLIPVFLPFNLIKGGINAGLTLFLYKPLVTALRRARLVPASGGKDGEKPFQAAFLLIGFALLSLFVLIFLFFSGVL